jgi:serine phosphatase RsbU (regulator of sigma subunit)
MQPLQELTSAIERLGRAASFEAASDALVAWAREYSGCRAAILRMLVESDQEQWLGGCAASGATESFIRDETLIPITDSICGRVTAGNTDPALPFFTPGGSFNWGRMGTLLTDFSAEAIGTTRGRCIVERYESVGIFPLRADGRVVGSLHLGDSRPDLFADTGEVIETVCRLAGSVLIRHKTSERDRLLLDKIQSALIPTVPTDLGGLSVGVSFGSATEMARLGGDFYDVIDLGASGILFLVGDVSGKGLEAAGIATRARYTLEARATEKTDPAAFMHTANEALLKFLPRQRFVTAVACLIEPWSGLAKVCLAGHPPPLHFNDRGSGEISAPHNPPLGVFPDVPFQQAVETFQHGDVLVVYTDGVADSRRNAGEFGIEGISSAVNTISDHDPGRIASVVCSAATEYHDATLPADDRLVMAVRIN